MASQVEYLRFVSYIELPIQNTAKAQRVPQQMCGSTHASGNPAIADHAEAWPHGHLHCGVRFLHPICATRCNVTSCNIIDRAPSRPLAVPERSWDTMGQSKCGYEKPPT